jgi:hypothetical protein
MNSFGPQNGNQKRQPEAVTGSGKIEKRRWKNTNRKGEEHHMVFLSKGSYRHTESAGYNHTRGTSEPSFMGDCMH